MPSNPQLRKIPRDLTVLRIELVGIEPTIWRRFAVPENITLGKLHDVIQAVMGWHDCHLHEFEIAGVKYGIPDPDGWGAPVNPEARKTLIKALQGQKTFNYLYDFGDDWLHTIKVEETLPATTYKHVPYCIDGANTCPPEDVGGPHGYEMYLSAMEDPGHPDHDAMVQWRGKRFDPTVFDTDYLNRWFKRNKC
ncbi:plasmid pRiA4b ORF-3 family protein [Pseudomonas sp. NPDC089752]|uniref:plasmid pRiA4b ORF-3 family protein n=1 Tax=Pseudomonas sp. NPDC089752 TaxID=3364472 RepID=UPI0037FA9295